MNHLEYLDSFSKFKTDGGYKPGLERVQAILDRLGNPEKQVQIIHIAGTNGKGSTSAMISSILRQGGYSVGLYTSPHLQDFRERFRLNGVPISHEELAQVVDEIKPAIEAVTNIPEFDRPSYFEVVTALAFLYYARKKVDSLVLEVGLGGRLDATNVAQPLVSVITTIGFDHMEYLGNTLGEIATEKAGIVKAGTPVVIGVRDQEAIEAIERKANEKQAPLYQPVNDATWVKTGGTLRAQRVDLTLGDRSYHDLEIALLGEHQIRNAIVAIKTIELVQSQFPKVDEQAIRRGLSLVRWPGRLELAQENPPVLLDGAHNIEGVEALATFLEQVKGDYDHLYLVMSILKDKEFAPMVRRVAHLATSITFTQNHSLRASSAEDLAQILAGEEVEIHIIPDFPTAIHSALEKANPRDLVCITGSLYTIAEARAILFPEEIGNI